MVETNTTIKGAQEFIDASDEFGAYRLIPLTREKFAMVDPSDYDMLMQWKWMAKFDGWNWYARRNQYGFGNGKSKTLFMHRIILNTPGGVIVDHQDRNGLNCRRYNIRNCTSRQNAGNRRKQKETSSKYYGVYLDRHVCNGIEYFYWNVGIKINGKRINLGNYKVEEDAAKVYDIKAKEIFGEFATLNFK